MNLQTWFEGKPRGTISCLHRRTGVSFQTLKRLRAGEPTSNYLVAKAIEEGTDGQVTAIELLEPAAGGPRGLVKTG